MRGDALGRLAGLAAACFVLTAICTFARAGERVELKYKKKFQVVTEKVELVSKDLTQIVFRKEGAAPGDTMTIPWTDVRSFNGQLPEQVLADMRKALADRLCPVCGGGAIVTKCERCRGTGRISDKTMPCPACKGTGKGPCRAPGCKGGRVPCSGPCIKRSEGDWEPWPGHGVARVWRWKDASGKERLTRLGEEHIGEVWEFTGTKVVSRGRCELCKGTGSAPCKVCGGTGKGECAECRGTGVVPDLRSSRPCPDCRGGIVICKACGGTGIVGGTAPPAAAPPAAETPGAEAKAPEPKPEKDPNVIRLKDGTVLRGKIMMSMGKEVIVKTEAGQILKLDRDQIVAEP